jgi:monofunctional biosynthetic peptidoglycan transglycosylase
MARAKKSRAKKQGVWRAIARAITFGLVGFVTLSIVIVAMLRWIDPPTSAFMIRHWVVGHLQAEASADVYFEWVEGERIPAVLKLAVIAAEDQRFPNHRGFDTIELQQALATHQAGGRLRGASTITQQTAKNLFLWPGRDPLRKVLEAWLTVLIEVLWSKERILEVYLNLAQFSGDTFGVGAASWRYFHRPVVAIRAEEAALMASVLPNPVVYRLDAPSGDLTGRAQRIRREMARLGGIAYLRGL